LALPLIQVLASHKRPHRKASFIRFIAGCWRFFTFTQLGETRERYGRSTWKMQIDLDESERQLPAATFVSFNKILNNGWHIVHLEIAATHVRLPDQNHPQLNRPPDRVHPAQSKASNY
jgi:hypothetical protein